MTDLRIADVRITPIAFADPPLLNNGGCHQPFALRSIIEVETEDGVIGLGESYGNRELVEAVEALAPRLAGMAVTDLNGLWARARGSVMGSMGGYTGAEALLPRVVGAVEVGMWDALGKSLNLRVCDLLGGAVRDRVPYSAYLFYKFAGHKGQQPDPWGEVLTPEQLVDEARAMVEAYGFRSLKLKAGILEPEEEIAGLEALRDAFPEAPLRIDPNGGWHVHTALKLLPRLEGLVEYLEDPTVGIAGNAVIQAATDIPLATNMYVVADGHLAARHRAGCLPGDPVRPPLLGRAEGQPGSCADLRDMGAGPVDAFELPPRHQPGGDDPPGGGLSEPDL